MKTRTFNSLTLIAFALTMMAFAVSSCSTREKGKNIGLQLYSIRDSIKKDVPGSIRKVAGMGYRFVEPAGYAGGKFYNLSPEEFKALCLKNGMNVLSSHTGRPAPAPEDWDAAMAWWDTCIAAHLAVGAKYIVQPSMGRDAYESLEGITRYCDYFNAVGEKCNKAGIRFGYHNHSREFTTIFDSTVVLYDFMLQNTDPEKVFFQLDLYWCVEGGADPVDYFTKYPGRFELWHIKDEAELGASGKMDFEKIWKSAGVSGMKYGIVEVEKYNYDQFTSCRMSLEFLNNAGYVVMPL